MIDINECNNKLIQRDLSTLMSLNRYLNSFSISDRPILFLNFMRYNNFIILEILDYLRKVYNIDIIKDLKNKKIIKKIRSKLKCNLSVLKTSNEINELMHQIFKSMNNPIIMRLFPNLCDNYGIFAYGEDCVIANTFEIYAMIGKALYKNGRFDKKKIMSYSEEIGSLLSSLCNIFKINERFKSEIVLEKRQIRSKGYNLYKYIKDENINETIFLINKLVALNFYKSIILNQFKNELNSLDIKLKYVLCRNIIKELKEININYICDEYLLIYDNKDFRNFMYHYSFPLSFDDVKNDKLLYGIPEYLLKISEDKLNSILNDCIEKLILNLHKEIKNSNYNFLLNL